MNYKVREEPTTEEGSYFRSIQGESLGGHRRLESRGLGVACGGSHGVGGGGWVGRLVARDASEGRGEHRVQAEGVVEEAAVAHKNKDCGDQSSIAKNNSQDDAREEGGGDAGGGGVCGGEVHIGGQEASVVAVVVGVGVVDEPRHRAVRVGHPIGSSREEEAISVNASVVAVRSEQRATGVGS